MASRQHALIFPPA